MEPNQLISPIPAYVASQSATQGMKVNRAMFDEVMVPNYAPSSMIPVRGRGSRVWDQTGREHLDLAGGIAVSALGHCHPKVVAALIEQGQRIWHLSNVMTNEPAIRLAKKLVESTFADRVFFCNSGGEANEAALKLARKYAKDHYNADKVEIVAAFNSFHGRTLFTVSVGGQEKYTKGFEPLPPGIKHVPYNDIAALEAVVTDKTCAVVLEPLQGEGGVTSGTAEYLQAARRLCDQTGALLIFDEVQSGNSRTGTLYNYMRKGVTPDVLTTAKGLGGGFPIGAMMCTEKAAKSLGIGTHGSTYGGNALACAVAEAVFDEISQPTLLAGVATRSEILMKGLRDIGTETGIFKEIRGEGLLVGAELSDGFRGRAKDLMKAGEAEAVMFLQAGPDVLRFAPSLIISEEDLTEGLARVKKAVQAVLAA